MAATKEAPAPQSAPSVPLTADNMAGIVQRILVELHAYMAPGHWPDPDYVMARLEEAASWVQRLPRPAKEEEPQGNGRAN